MFKAVLDDISLLKESLIAISELIDEATFKLEKGGISLLAPDRAVIAVADFVMFPTAFESYKCDKETSIGLNLQTMLKFLKRAKATDKLILTLDENEDRFVMVLSGTSTREFHLPIISISEQELPDLSKFKFDTKVEITPSLLREGLDNAGLISDSVLIKVDKNQVIFRAEGDSSLSEVKAEEGNPNVYSISTPGPVEARYSIDYLSKMLKAGKLTDKVKLEFNKDYPLRLEFSLKDKIRLAFILAPRVEE